MLLNSHLRHWVACLLLVCSYAACAATNQTSGPRLLVLGDSLSAGYGMELAEGWVSLLQQRLAEQHPQSVLINASISGETSSGVRSRLPSLLEQHQPDLAIVEIGGNDGLRALSLQQLEANLRAIITQLQHAGARVLLVGMQIPPNYGPHYTQRFSELYPRLAEEYGLALVPFLLEGVAGNSELMQADGMHASAAAQPQLLENVWPELQRMLTITSR